MHNPADHSTIIDPFHAANIGRQVRLDPSPLLVAQPKQVLAHDPNPLQTESASYGIRIVLLAHHV